MEENTPFLPGTETEYLKTRVENQIKWYDRKSVTNKKWFLLLKVSEIFLALFIPFISGYIGSVDDPLKVVVGMLGVIVAAIAGLITLIKFQENWIEYRTVAETLKFEKFLFLAKAGPYKNSDPYPLFVERFESLISTSTKKWMNYVSNKESGPPPANQGS
jgi:intein/homing endonuclease